MTQLQRHRDLVAAVLGGHEIRRQRSSGELLRLRRGMYAVRPQPLAYEEAHHRLVRATIPVISGDAVVSHVSAAVLHGLPIWRGDMSVVHVTRNRRYGGRLVPTLAVHASTLPDSEVVLVDGIRVTSLARTVADLLRQRNRPLAVAAGDAALRAGLDLAEVADLLDAMKGWPGTPGARRLLMLLDGRAESPGESASRLAIHDAGLPTPELQHHVMDEDGLAGIVDHWWEEFGWAGEYDGLTKYGRLVPAGRTSTEVLVAEKRREDRIRAVVAGMTRWTTADLDDGSAVRALRRVLVRRPRHLV